jgi:hypothetical protein
MHRCKKYYLPTNNCENAVKDFKFLEGAYKIGRLLLFKNKSLSFAAEQRIFSQSQSQSYFTTGGLPSISSSWRQAPWDAAGPRQRSHSRVQVPRDSWPHFAVSDSRFPQPGGQGPCTYTPRNRVAQLFVASYNSQRYGGGIRPRLHTGSVFSENIIIFMWNVISPLSSF